MPFVKIAFDIRQDELSADEFMKDLVSVMEHPRDVLTSSPFISILSAQWRAARVILLDLLDRKRISFSILPVVVTTQDMHLVGRRPVARIKVGGALRVFGLEFV